MWRRGGVSAIAPMSESWRREQQRAESVEGWPDAPRWRSPAEVAELRGSMNVEARLQTIIANIFSTTEELLEDSRFGEDLGGDSLDVMCLVVDIEKEFGVTLADADIERVKTFGDLVGLVTQKLAER